MGKGRTAQVWAVEIMEKIEEQIRRGAELPFNLPIAGGELTKNNAIRTVQEVNFARKRKYELIREREQAALISGLTPPAAPQELFWKLGFKMDGEAVCFYVGFPTGRQTRVSEVSGRIANSLLQALNTAGQDLPEPVKVEPIVKPSMDSVIDKYLFGD